MKHHVILVAEKDSDIIAFKKYLSYGKFNETVNKILWHAVRGDIPDDPVRFEIDVYAPTMHTKVELPAELEKKCRDRYRSSGEPFTTGIKNDIKRYIRKNRQDPIGNSIEHGELRQILDDTQELLEDIQEDYENAFERNKIMLRSYRRVLNNLVAQFESKMSSLPSPITEDEEMWEVCDEEDV